MTPRILEAPSQTGAAPASRRLWQHRSGSVSAVVTSGSYRAEHEVTQALEGVGLAMLLKMAMAGNVSLVTEVAALKDGLKMSESSITELEARVDLLENALVDMEVIIVDGYVVRVWREANAWIAYCPTVGVVVEEDGREVALNSIRDDMQEMIEALVQLGDKPPRKDITCGDAQTSSPIRKEDQRGT